LVYWPAIIKLAGDAELDYVADQAAWETDSGLGAMNYDESDCLIDATGAVYTLVRRDIRDRVVPEASGEIKSLEQVLGLVKAHAAQADSCCVAKLFAPTIVDAMAMVKALDAEQRKP